MMAKKRPQALDRLYKSGIKVHWDAKIPKEVKEAFKPILSRFELLFPGWIESLTVQYDNDTMMLVPSSDASEMPTMPQMATKYDYTLREATFLITGRWMGLCYAERIVTVAHEISHILLGPFHGQVEIMKQFISTGEGNMPYINAQLDAGLESTVEDMARMIVRIYGPQLLLGD